MHLTLLCKDFSLFIEKQAISQELFTEILFCAHFCGSASISSSLKSPSIYPLIQDKHFFQAFVCGAGSEKSRINTALALILVPCFPVFATTLEAFYAPTIILVCLSFYLYL